MMGHYSVAPKDSSMVADWASPKESNLVAQRAAQTAKRKADWTAASMD